jgi:uncharacterized membrane protein
MPSRVPPMHIRTRKFLGGFLLLAFLVVYSLLAMVVGAELAMEWPELGRVAFYATAGLLWLPVVMVIIRWMARPNALDEN